MKKRIFSMFLALALCLSLQPAVVMADGGDSTSGSGHTNHCICGASHSGIGDHESENVITDWKPVSQQSDITGAGNYYLTGDVTLNNNWTIAHDTSITLCLNGHKLTSDNASSGDTILIEGTLTITDCKTTGTITGTNNTSSGNHKVLVVSARYADCTLNMYGGTITGINVGNGSGGGVHNEGIFNMYGGTITGNTASNGGGVDNYKNGTYSGPAVFNFYGGVIEGNTAGIAKDVYNDTNSTINANGGTVDSNVRNYGTIATANGYDGTTFNGNIRNEGTISGGIFNDKVENYEIIKGGTFNGTVKNDDTIEGGTFTGNVTNECAIKNGIFECTSTVINKTFSTITGGRFKGALYVKDGTNINGATISGTHGRYYGSLTFGTLDASGGGYTWNPDTKTLTLANVYVGTLEFDVALTNADITIIIEGTVEIGELFGPISTGTASDDPYLGKMIIQGESGREKATFKCGTIKTFGDEPLTLSGLRVTCNEGIHVCKFEAGRTAISDCGTLKLENCTMTMQGTENNKSSLTVKEIYIDDDSVLTLKNCSILNNGTENEITTDTLKNFLPDGVTVKRTSDELDSNSVYGFFKDDETSVSEVILKRYRYTIIYAPAAGVSNDEVTDIKKYGVDLILKGEIFQRTGYTQTGWRTEGGKSVYELGGTYTANASEILYPVWTISQYTITVKPENGDDDIIITQDYDTSVTAPTLTRDGYVFDGWDKTFPTTMPADSMTITAKWKNVTAPTGEITFGKNSWKTFLSNITFGLFCKDSQEVTITATDNGGEDVTIEYLLSDSALTAEQLAGKSFTAYTGKFNIDPNNEYVIYAKLTDKAGNVTYINSNGIVLDNVKPLISGITNGATYCSAQTVTVTEKYVDTVTVNGNPITPDADGRFTLSPSEGTQTVVVTDKAGNSVSITVTVNNDHTGGTATDTEKAKCEVCGVEYGEVNNTDNLSPEIIDGKNQSLNEDETGERTFGIVSQSGTATTTFATNAKVVVTDSPQTGDNSHMALWFTLALLGGTLAGVAAYGKKKKCSIK